ncbi:16173_t:CDS:1, partial [Gigaspora rosea]
SKTYLAQIPNKIPRLEIEPGIKKILEDYSFNPYALRLWLFKID